MGKKKDSSPHGGVLSVAEKSYNMVFNILNFALRSRFFLELPIYKSYLAQNKNFKNIHSGETCYILGNGPSLNEISLSKIKGKHVFATNLLFLSPIFDDLSPEYYCALDENTFSMYATEFRQVVEKNPKIEFFISRKARKYVEIQKNTHLLYPSWIPTSSAIKNDLCTGKLNSFINVIHFAIAIATYMGFHKIYLLGCDFTLTFAAPKHCYENDVSVFKKMHPYRYLGSAIAFRQHMYIAQWAKRKHLEIYNATPNSILDVYPMVSFEDIE